MLAERTDLCAYLAEELFVLALEDDERILVTLALGLYANLCGKLDKIASSNP